MADAEEVSALANALIGRYLARRGWSFGFDGAKRRAGVCKFRERRIQLSRVITEARSLDDAEQVLLHEIAHALAGPRAGHGPRWRVLAARIGYRAQPVSDGGVAEREAPIVGACPNGHTFYRYRMPSGVRSCPTCASRFDARFLISWSRR